MPSKQVTIQGVMTWDEASSPPLGIWGGSPVPMPTPPIQLPTPPLGIWGGSPVPMPTPPIHLTPPNIWGGSPVPMPTPPIYLPPLGIWGGGNQPFPTPPIYQPGSPGGAGSPPNVAPPAANVPMLMAVMWVPGQGYMWVPISMQSPVPPDEPPEVTHHEGTLER
jgi:hypothetical protein